MTNTASNTLIQIPFKLERTAPPFEGNDVKYPEGFVRHLLKEYTNKKDVVFDPFSGLGTTLFVAEEMGRIPYGIEAERQKYEWVAGQLENWTHLINDDAANLNRYKIPKANLVITSPPYMPRHHKWNPLYGGDPKHAGYDKYLKRMNYIFKQIAKITKRHGHFIIQADNLNHKTGNTHIFTPLVSDLSNAVPDGFVQTDHITVLWSQAPKDYPMTQCLVFRKK